MISAHRQWLTSAFSGQPLCSQPILPKGVNSNYNPHPPAVTYCTWGFTPKEYGGVMAFCAALSAAPVLHWQKHPCSCCNATSSRRRKPVSSQTLREYTHFHSHHLFNLPTEHEDSNRKHCIESACLRVLQNSYYLPFLFLNVSAQSCSPLHPSTTLDLNSLTSIRKLMNKQEMSISNNLFKTNKSKKPRTMKSVP